MKTMSDWLSRAAALPRDYTVIDGTQITSARGIDDLQESSHPVFTRHDFVTTVLSRRNQLVVRECRSAGD